MDIIECLMKIGFTRYESILYVTLCKEGELTGYEAAKISGISRSNAYLALAGLTEKGGAHSIDGEAVRYSSVPVKELVYNTRRQTEEKLEYILENIPSRESISEPYITISGRNNIINKMKNIINLATERIYISMSLIELEYVKNEINQAAKRGLKIVIITSEPYELEDIICYINDKRPGQIRIIADTSQVITGEIVNNSSMPSCLYSKNKNLIELIKESLTNEIKLINAKKD